MSSVYVHVSIVMCATSPSVKLHPVEDGISVVYSILHPDTNILVCIIRYAITGITLMTSVIETRLVL